MGKIEKYGSIEKYGTVVCKEGELIQITGFTFVGYPRLYSYSSREVEIVALQWAADKIQGAIDDAMKRRDKRRIREERCVCADYMICTNYDCKKWATKAIYRYERGPRCDNR